MFILFIYLFFIIGGGVFGLTLVAQDLSFINSLTLDIISLISSMGGGLLFGYS